MRQHISQLFLIACFSLFANSTSMAKLYVAGDLAPRGAPDSVLNVADFLVMQRIIMGAEAPSPTELIVGDIGPLGSPDDILNVADLLILQRAILGDAVLDTVIVYPEAPTLNSIPTTTLLNPITVTGNAIPGQSVHITVNNTTQIIIPVDVSGTFSFKANLYDGANQIYAFANDGEHFSDPSNLLNTSYTNEIVRNQNVNILVDTVWTPGVPAAPYEITGQNLTIAAGVKLVIQPGTVVKTNNGINIIVEGELIVNGTQFTAVEFTSSNNLPNSWRGIQVNSGGNLSMTYASVKFANTGISFDGGNGNLDHVIVTDNQNNGIQIKGSSPIITASEITDNGYAGIAIYRDSNPIINGGNLITRNFYYGILILGEPGLALSSVPNPTINRNSIYNNARLDAYVTNFNNARGVNINFRENWWGSNDLDVITYKINGFNDNEIPYTDFSNYLDAENGKLILANFLMGDLEDGLILSANSTYDVINDIYVPLGSTITIEEGVTLRFATTAEFIIRGQVNWPENSSNLATFTRYEGKTAAWKGIAFENGMQNIHVKNIHVLYADCGLTFTNTVTGSVSGSFFEKNGNGICLSASDVAIQSNTLQFNLYNGISVAYGSKPLITQNIIMDNVTNSQYGRYGITITGHHPVTGNYSAPVIHNNHIYRHRYGNVGAVGYTGNQLTPPIIDATNNWWGTNDASEIEANTLHVPDNANNTAYINYSGFYSNEEKTETDSRQILFNLHEMIKDEVIPANSRYIVAENIKVPLGLTLTIQEGAELYFVAGKKIEVLGNLNINGSLLKPVLLTGAKTLHDNYDFSTGEWKGVELNNNIGIINIKYANIEYATVGVEFINSTGTITNSTFTNNFKGIRIVGDSTPLIQSSVITNNFYGIEFVGSAGIDPSPTISGNDIYNNSVPEYQSPNIAANIAFNSITNPQLIDLSNNWWNTADIVSTRATFYDPNSIYADLVTISSINPQANRSDVTYVKLTLSESLISPTISLGTQDNLLMTANLAQSVNWEIKIRNSSGTVVKTFAGAGTAISQSWNGLNASAAVLPDGIYRVSIVINAGIEQTVNQIIIDNTLPTANLINLNNGDTLNGFDYITLALLGTAIDSNFLSYQISVANGHSPLPSDFTRIIKSSTASVYNSLFSDWPFADVNNASFFETSGPKTLRLSVLDKAGNESIYTVQLNIIIPVKAVSHDVSSIDPSKGEKVRVSFTLYEPATVKLQFFSDQKATLPENKLAEVSGTYIASGTYELEWDGKGLDGTYLPDEAYRYALLVEPTPTSSFLYSSNEYPSGPVNGALLGIDYAAKSYFNKFVKFSYTTTGPARILLAGHVSEARDVGTYHFYWDHRDVNNKLFDVVSEMPGTFSNHLLKDSVIIRGSEPEITGTEYDPTSVIKTPAIEVQSTPYVVVHSFEQISEIAFRISQNSYVDVRLLSPCYVSDTTCVIDHDDPTGITLMERQLLEAEDASGDPISHTAEWRGYDFAASTIDANNIRVSEEGAYTFSIRAESAVTGLVTIYRGVLNLYH